MVPVVIRNAGEIPWRNGKVARPGTIQVAVLAPIDVSAWNRDNLTGHVAAVRQLYVDKLTHWPSD